MFQLFLRARVQNYFKSRAPGRIFQARSADRDRETDRLRVSSISEAIENALHAAEQERAGLDRRVEDVLARAAVTLGNAADEYLERELLDNHHQNLFSIDISNGQQRLKELAAEIAHFKFLKSALLSRFPDYSPQNKS
jgi:hypothetical protein